MKINTPVPSGLSFHEAKWFHRFSQEVVSAPKIRKIRNAFISHYGLVLKHGLLVPGCAFNLLGRRDHTFYGPFWRKTIEEYAVCRWGKSLPFIEVEDPCLLIHSKWFNYGFWVNAYLPRLLMAKEKGLLKDVVLLMPEGWKTIPYVQESLKAFSFTPKYIPDGAHVFAKTLFMPETRPWTSSFYPPLLARTAAFLKESALGYVHGKDFPERVYLTRKKRGVRCVENEEEVLNTLIPHGFTAVDFDDFSFWEQINMMKNASHFVSIHGAGFTNLMFMGQKGKAIELINAPYAKVEYTFPFWKLAHAIGVKYRPVFCEISKPVGLKTARKGTLTGDERDYLVNQNLEVSIPRLLEAIQPKKSSSRRSQDNPSPSNLNQT
jgi:hypothetical protein